MPFRNHLVRRGVGVVEPAAGSLLVLVLGCLNFILDGPLNGDFRLSVRFCGRVFLAVRFVPFSRVNG